MAFVATIPCALSTGPVGLVTWQTPLASVPGGLSGWGFHSPTVHRLGLSCADCNSKGLGCPGCGGTCGGVPKVGGMGALTFDGSGFLGSGIFGTGVDAVNLSTWGPGEFALAGIGLLASFTLWRSIKSTGRRTAEGVRRVRRRAGDAVAGKKRSKKKK